MKRFLLSGIATLLATIPAWAEPLPLDTRADWSSVVDAAKWQANNDRPVRLSAPGTTPEYVTYSGTWTPTQNMMRLAIFSDDGCDVWIDGQKVLSNKNRGQALPDLANSLIPLSGTFVANQTYTIQIAYSNTFYLGSADIDGVTLFAYRDGKREWQPSEGNEGKIGQGRSTQGNWIENGRLKAPFDQRTGQTQTVKVGPGGRLGFEIEAATDYDLWKDKDQNGSVSDSGVWQDEVVSYTWKCSAGKFVVTGSDGQEQLVDTVTGEDALTATWVAWSVSSPPQTVRVWCEIEDEGPTVPSGETGSRDDEKLVREQSVEVVPVQLLVRRMGASISASARTKIATGGKNSPEQKAKVYLSLPSGISIGPVKIVNGETGNLGLKAQLSMTSPLEGTLTGQNVVGDELKLRLDSGSQSPEAIVEQRWSEVEKWDFDPYFEVGKATNLQFTPLLLGDALGETLPVREQKVGFRLTSVDVLLWTPQANDFRPFTFTPGAPKWNIIKQLVKFDPPQATSSSGSYSTKLTVADDPQRIVMSVGFDACGMDVYERTP